MGESASWLGRVLVLFRYLSNLTINNWALTGNRTLTNKSTAWSYVQKKKLKSLSGWIYLQNKRKAPFPAQAEKPPVQLETTGFWARSQGSGDIYNLKRVGVPNKLLYSFSITSLSKATASSVLFSTQNACFP